MTTTPPPRPHTYTHTFGSANTAVTRLLDALSGSGTEVCSSYALKPGTDVTIGFHDLELETTLSQDGVLSIDLSEDNPNWQATEA